MIKSIIKEILIILFLAVAIVLLLGIILYDYNPTSKTVPSKVEAYVLPEEVHEELNETLTVSETQSIIKTYKVDGHDLKVYSSTKSYDKGKPNPFGPIQNSGVPGGSSSTNTIGTGNSNGQTGSQGQFLNTIGK